MDSVPASIHALAGAAGGALALTLTYPLSTVSIRLQVQGKQNQVKYLNNFDAFIKIIREEGWSGLYSGLNSGLVAVVVAQGIYYFFYSISRKWVEKLLGAFGSRHPHVVNLLVASISGIITVFTTNPIGVINTRMTVEDKEKGKGMLETSAEIIREEGFLGLWRGVIPALLLVSNPTIQYMMFEWLKEIVERKGNPAKAFHFFLMGAFGKVVATLATFPYIVIKSRQHLKGHSQSKGTFSSLQEVWKQEGFLGFYKGLSTKITQSVLNAAFLFLFKEEIVRLVVFFYKLFAKK